MTDEAWVKGMAELVAALPSQTSAAAEVRGRVYREELRHLNDQQWLFAVREAIRHERWFPTVSCLLDYALDFEPAVKLLGPGRSDEQRAHDREEARRGLEEIRRRCPWLAPEAVHDVESAEEAR